MIILSMNYIMKKKQCWPTADNLVAPLDWLFTDCTKPAENGKLWNLTDFPSRKKRKHEIESKAVHLGKIQSESIET